MLRTVIIGGGAGSAVGAAHVAAMRMTGEYDIVAAMFSSDPTRNAASAALYNVPTACDSVAALLDREIDRVVILSPTPKHFEHIGLVRRQNGAVPILCEKALGATPTETANLVIQTGDSLSTVFNYAFYPAVQRLRELIKEGTLGEIYYVEAAMPQNGYLTGATPQAWRLTDIGVYLDLGVHLHHLIWYLTKSKPVGVRSAYSGKFSPVGVTDFVTATVEYPNFMASYYFSKCDARDTNGLRVRVQGTKGGAEWYQRRPDVLRLNENAQAEATLLMEIPNPRFKRGHPTGYVEALANLYDRWSETPQCSTLSPAVAHEGVSLMYDIKEKADGVAL